MNNNINGQFGAMDLVNIIALLIGYENMLENRIQSAQNDVQAANDKQAHYLLQELKTMFEAQNAMLADIMQKLERLEGKHGTEI